MPVPSTQRSDRSPQSQLSRPVPPTAFARQVHDALNRLYDPVALQTHPLTRMLKEQGIGRPANAGAALRQQLIDTIQALRPEDAVTEEAHAWRSYYLLTLRYVEALDIPAVQAKLAVSKSEYFRDHRQALEALTSLLRERWEIPEQESPPVLRTVDGGQPSTDAGGWLDRGQRPDRLHRYLTSFVGRAADRTELLRLLPSARLLTLTGPGGIGKTRLALEVAIDVQATFGNGVYVVELAALTDGALVARSIATTLGVLMQPDHDVVSAIAAVVDNQHLCLVLDNCEHLVDAAAKAAEALLLRCPRLHVLATSREPLGIGGEVIWPVPPLALPPSDLDMMSSEVMDTEAVRLFVDRAIAARPSFALTPDVTAPVVSICRRLDGIPLAIELAAAQVRVLSLAQIAQRLADRFGLLTGGRTAAPRQQTLRATVDWSYDLLAASERALFHRLSVFAGGWTLEAAEVVGQGEGIEAAHVLPQLARLADQSLILVEQRHDAARYRMLETIRQYAQERLDEVNETDSTSRRLSGWALRLVEQAWAEKAGPRQVTWLDRLETEHDNLRAALGWCLRDDPPAGLRVASHLYSFWEIRGYRAEGRQWLERLLAAAPAPTIARARALVGHGILASYAGDPVPARESVEEGLRLATELGDAWSRGMALHELGHLAVEQDGDQARGRAHMEESLTLLQAIGDVYGTSSILRCLGSLLIAQRDEARGKALYDQNIALTRAHDNRWQLAWALGDLGRFAWMHGEHDQARALLEESLALYRETRHWRGLAVICQYLGGLARAGGNYAGAQTWLEESLAIFRQIGDRPLTAQTLLALANVFRLRGDLARAKSLVEESRAILQELGNQRGVVDPRRQSARIAETEGDREQARAAFQEILDHSRAIGDAHLAALTLGDLGRLAWQEQDYARAQALWRESLEGLALCGHPWCRGWALAHSGMLAVHHGSFERGVWLLGAASAAYAPLLVSFDPDERADCQGMLATARAALGFDQFAAAWAEGQAMGMEQVVACALEE